MLPVDVPALQTCTMGRTLSRMKKSGPEALQRDVSLLVAEWKKLVGESAPSAAPAVGDKRPRFVLKRQQPALQPIVTCNDDCVDMLVCFVLLLQCVHSLQGTGPQGSKAIWWSWLGACGQAFACTFSARLAALTGAISSLACSDWICMMVTCAL